MAFICFLKETRRLNIKSSSLLKLVKGGPLYDKDNNVLVGVVSWGYGCAQEGMPFSTTIRLILHALILMNTISLV